MKRTLYLIIILFFSLTSFKTFGQKTDSKVKIITSAQTDTIATEKSSAAYDESGDFSPGLFFFAMIGLVFLLTCVGTGIVLTVLGLLILFGLVSFGILSTSIIVGLNKKSFAKGFKTFIVLISTIGGLLFCVAVFWLYNKIVHWWTLQTTIIIGSTFGLLAGLAFGLLAFYVLQRLTTYFKQKLNLTTEENRSK
ncbi:MAG TPA: hypothetical protein VNG53_11655 [Bacteroidia bacterium]|nr:hypothetical protein [Bacteroidia bacterium]